VNARAWIVAARPKTLACALVPVAVGSAVAFREGAFRWDAAVTALMGAVWIQIGTNVANDVFDFEQGADTPDRLGPPRAVASGLLTAGQARTAMAVAFAAAALAGAYLIALRGAPVLAIGVSSIAAGVAYTRGKRSLGYLGLGDLFVFVFFGLVAVTGTTFVESGGFSWLSAAAAVPVGALATTLIVVNNVRDRVTDERADKRTLVVRFGRSLATKEMVVLLATAHVVPVLLAAARLAGWPVLATLLFVPASARLARDAAIHDGRALNDTLARAARLLLSFGVVFAGGLAAS
jgi:1,4-dihydroxy-2-naphthoate octaprenyltransferase